MPSNKKLVLARRISEESQQRLRAWFPDLQVVDCSGDRRDRLAREIADAHYLFGKIGPDDFSRAASLEFIQVDTRGVDRIMFAELLASPVRVANAGDVYSLPMAEHTVMLILALYRNLPAYLRWQDRALWNPEALPFRVLHGKTVGFLGTGSIARHTARLCAVFGCTCVGFNRAGRPVEGFSRVFPEGDLDEMLAAGDVIVNTLPLTEKTRHLMNRARFSAMKEGAVFINVGRGKTVDETALLEALESGRLSGAGLDVFEQEPLPPENPLWHAPNTIITGHRSGSGVEDETAIVDILAENLRRIRDGRELLHPVDKNNGY